MWIGLLITSNLQGPCVKLPRKEMGQPTSCKGQRFHGRRKTSNFSASAKHSGIKISPKK